MTTRLCDAHDAVTESLARLEQRLTVILVCSAALLGDRFVDVVKGFL